MNNAAEVVAGTSPLDASSRFKVQTIEPQQGGGMTVSWDVVAGRTYAVEASDTLAPGSWTTLATGLTSGNYTDTRPLEQRRFYRVRVSR